MTVRSRRAGAAAICLLLALVHTWPLVLHPGRNSRNDNADTELNEWILAWVAHQLPRDPAHLFEANIFYPSHDVLAFSEPLIVPALIGAPLSWAGASPVLVFNLVLIAGFALTAFATWLLVEAWTGDMAAGLLAGSLFAFNTHTLTRLPHIQAIHIYGLPLTLLACDRLIRGAGRRDAVLLAVWLTVMTYTSGYLFVFGCVLIALAVIVRTGEWIHRSRTFAPRLLLSGVGAAILIFPLSLPYRRVAREQHMVRTLDVVRDFSATLKGYLITYGRLHYDLWAHRYVGDPIDAFFPGFVVLALAAIAVVYTFRRGTRQTDALRPRVVMLVVVAAAGVVLSLGPATSVYGWLFAVFPPMQGLRAAARFGNLFLLSIAILGGLGLALVRRNLLSTHARAMRWVAIGLVVLVNLESLRAPFEYREFTGIPGIYRLLAQEPGPVVLAEQPFYPRDAVFENGLYVLNSTAHWRPLMNGYSGYTPESYQHYADTFWYFPEAPAIQSMKDAGVTHVIVHPERFDRDAEKVMQQVSARADLELVAIGPHGMRLYRLKR